MTRRVEIFFSYAQEDEDLTDGVRTQRIVFDRQDLFGKWHDWKISGCWQTRAVRTFANRDGAIALRQSSRSMGWQKA